MVPDDLQPGGHHLFRVGLGRIATCAVAVLMGCGGESADFTPCPDGAFGFRGDAAVSGAPYCAPWTVCSPGTREDVPGSESADRTCIAVDGWPQQFGSLVSDEAHAVHVDSAGNVVVAGMTSGTLPGGRSGFGVDAFVRKYTHEGVALWTRQFGSSLTDWAYAVDVDSAGNVVVAGFTSGALEGNASAGEDDAFVSVYTSDGTPVWTQQFGTPGIDLAWAVSVDEARNVFVAGWVSGTLPGEVSAGGADAFLRKYGSDGTLLWTRQFGSNAEDRAQGVSVDATGDVLVVGYTEGTLPGGTMVGARDGFIRRYASDGTLMWSEQLGTGGNGRVEAVVTDASGNAYVAGRTAGTVAGETSAGGTDAFLQKYAGDGALLWTRQFGTPTEDEAFSVGLDGSGGVFIAGRTFGALAGHTSAGGHDAFVQDYSAEGVLLWDQQLGTASDDFAAAVSVNESGEAVVAGYTLGVLPGATSVDAQSDAFVVIVPAPEP